MSLSIQEKKFKIDFQDGHLAFPIGMILAIFDLPVTPILPNKFRVIWPFGSGEEGKNRFSRWPPWPNNFSYFLSTSHSKASYAGSRPFDSGEEVNKRAMMALYCSPEQHSTLRA